MTAYYKWLLCRYNHHNLLVIILFIVIVLFFNEAHTIEKRYVRRNAYSSPKLHAYSSKYWQSELTYNVKNGQDSGKPYFDESTSRNVTTTKLRPAYLHCRVINLGSRIVSWIRKKDLNILTIGTFTYTHDGRYKTIHMENSDDWTLEISYPESKDEGVYECQVSTVPKMSLKVQLNVVEAKAEIVGSPGLYINSGSSIKLICVIKDSPIDGPNFVFWQHNGRTIDYDADRGNLNISAKKSTTTSILSIKNAKNTDSGNYTCDPSNASPASIFVHVLNGEHRAAMQDINDNSSANSPNAAGDDQSGGIKDSNPNTSGNTASSTRAPIGVRILISTLLLIKSATLGLFFVYDPR